VINSARGGGAAINSKLRRFDPSSQIWIEKSQEFDKNTKINEIILEHHDAKLMFY
jgi:hypothetical protein